jgi:hypothetical protein
MLQEPDSLAASRAAGYHVRGQPQHGVGAPPLAVSRLGRHAGVRIHPHPPRHALRLLGPRSRLETQGGGRPSTGRTTR